jgi:hypothetical protein
MQNANRKKGEEGGRKGEGVLVRVDYAAFIHIFFSLFEDCLL